jgi:signal transduction histidine kinase
LSSGISTQGKILSNTWLHLWIYYLAAGLMFAAAAMRSILVFQDSLIFGQILLLLAAWLLIFTGSALLAHRLPWLSAVLIGLEVLAILQLLLVAHTDFFAFLFAISSMQAMQQYSMKETAVVIGITTLLTFLTLYKPFGVFYALGTAVVFFGGSVFLVVYIGSTRRARLIEGQQQELVGQLQQANRQLELYSQQLQHLAAGRERQRLARELHDSVTQTIFSMTLTTQSALLLLERDRRQVAAQLDRLYQLAHIALTEMQTLISKLAPENTGDFVSVLKRHLAERHRLDNLSVSLEVEGNQALSVEEEQSLFRIAQEALNNVVKHAGVNKASLRLHLEGQPWLEILDQGTGFDSLKAGNRGQLGLLSMHERAVEIGWELRVDSSPGNGTRVRVQKDSLGEKLA